MNHVAFKPVFMLLRGRVIGLHMINNSTYGGVQIKKKKNPVNEDEAAAVHYFDPVCSFFFHLHEPVDWSVLKPNCKF